VEFTGAAARNANQLRQEMQRSIELVTDGHSCEAHFTGVGRGSSRKTLASDI
jgi:hypothetical protein